MVNVELNAVVLDFNLNDEQVVNICEPPRS